MAECRRNLFHGPMMIVVVALCLLPIWVHRTTAQESEAERERVERVSDILAALGVKEGFRAADVGSNDGFYTVRIARAVGQTGRAFAVDISAAALERLRQRIARDQITNLEPILGATNDPKLPAGELDAVLIRNAYHEMPEYRGVLAGIARGLKPGGILVIVEPIRDDRRSLPREEQVKEHEIAPELVEADLREAGFEVLERRERFTDAPRRPSGGFWLIRARRPGAPADSLSSLEFLIGRWQGTADGQPGKGTVERQYARALRTTFIESRNRSVYPPQEKNLKGETHEDLGIFSFDKARKRIVLRQFNVEGYVNHYVQQDSATPGVLVFETEAIENIPSGWRARETYRMLPSDELEEVFELAEPGKGFELYSTTRLHRLR